MIKFAGDYNGNGVVEQGDLDLVLLNWGYSISNPPAIGWANDLPTGAIDQGELDRVLLNWGAIRMKGARRAGAVDGRYAEGKPQSYGRA